MTPFKIRKRLKSLLGMDSPRSEDLPPTPERAVVELILVDGDGNEQRMQGRSEDTLLVISSNLPKPIGSGCNDSTCATCRVEVLEGADNLSPQTERERRTLAANGFPQTLRLACRTALIGDSARVRAWNFVEL